MMSSRVLADLDVGVKAGRLGLGELRWRPDEPDEPDDHNRDRPSGPHRPEQGDAGDATLEPRRQLTWADFELDDDDDSNVATEPPQARLDTLESRDEAEPTAGERPIGRGRTAAGRTEEVDRIGLGAVDQREREFVPAERRVADLLAGEGRVVSALRESDDPGVRRPDATVDGQFTEFKCPDVGATNVTIKAALTDAKGQARHAIVDGRGTGLTDTEAHRGLRRFLGAHPDRMDTIRILGDDFDIRWNRKD